MERTWLILVLAITPTVISAWKSSMEDTRNARDMRRRVHYHSKRHMLTDQTIPPEAQRRRTTALKRIDARKKPSGHLTPLQDDEMDNDEVVSVAVGPPPPPIRPKYDKAGWKKQKATNLTTSTRKVDRSETAINLVRDVLTQLGKEFLTRQVNEDFVFGQYVGNAMKNLTSELRLKMQHDILELIVHYQKINRGELVEAVPKPEERNTLSILKEMKIERRGNETDENWPDFSNLAKIVGR